MKYVRLTAFFLFIVLVWVNELCAGQYFKITPAIEQIYQEVWEMSFEEAYLIVDKMKVDEPDNLLVHHVENYIDFVRIFLTDDMRQLEVFRSDVERRLAAISLGDMTSPYYYYSQAEIYIQWSLVRSKNKEVVRAGWDINRAYKLLQRCKKEHPEFYYVNKSLSVIHALMGSLKGFRKTVIKLLTSLDGTVEQGIAEIEDLYKWNLHNPSLWSDEIVTVQSLVEGHMKKNWSRAFEFIDNISEGRKSTPLGKYLLASTAYHAGYNDKTIEIMGSEMDKNHTFHYLDLLTGTSLLNRGDPAARKYFLHYLDHHHGLNFLKSACQKMAWFELVINNNQEGYDQWMQRCREVGTTLTGEDQEAQLASVSGQRPDKHLLLSRLLFDGGYYERAWHEIQKFEPIASSEINNIEFNYRKGRILQKMQRFDEALSLLGQTVNIGQNEKEYFACNAALQMAYIFYDKGNYKYAERYAAMTLDINPDERRESLHDQAKLLLERIGTD